MAVHSDNTSNRKSLHNMKAIQEMSLEQLNKNSNNTLTAQLGIEYTLVTADRVEGTMPVDNRTRQPFGRLSGGATLALAENLAGLGSLFNCGDNQIAVGMQVTGNHISAALEGDTVRGIATPIHQGRTTHVWNVDVFSVTTGTLISTARVVNSIITASRQPCQ